MECITKRRARIALLVVVSALSVAVIALAQNVPSPIRTVLTRHDTTAAGFEAVLVKVVLPVGSREGRHTHPGLAVGYIEQGTLTLEHEGKATTEYKAGDAFILEAGKVHEGINKGNVPVTAIATFVVEKGVAMSTPAPGR